MYQSKPAVVLVCLITLGVCANAEPANLTGTITDPSGGVVRDASITAKCGSHELSTKSAADGSFSVALAAGSCRLRVTAAGFEAVTRDITFATDQAVVQENITLPLAHAATTLEIVDEAGQVALNQSSGTKAELPLIETPQAISVITQEQLVDRNVQTLNEALRYTPGVSVDTWGADQRLDWFMIRGFTEDEYGSYRDGLRWPSGVVRADPYGVEQVEVLKGPTSVLYGQNAPGGLVNMITKRPPAETRGEVAVTFGNYSYKQVQADIGGPVDDEGRLQYRLTGLFRDSDTQVDFTQNDRGFIAPAFTWNPSGKTSLTVLGDYQRDQTRWSQFLPSQGTLSYNPNGVIPISLFASEPDFDFVHQFRYAAGYQFAHHFNDTWTVRQNLRYTFGKYDGATAYGIGLEPDLRTLDRAAYSWNSGTGVTGIDQHAEARFRTGFIDHTVLAGFDYLRTNNGTWGQFGSAPTIDVFKPVYSQQIGALSTYTDTNQTSSQYGVYLQDQLKFGSHWVALLSGRQDWADSSTRDLLAASTSSQDNRAFTGRAGLLYDSGIGLAPYFSYSTSFLPIIGVDYYGNPYKPATGRQEEAGVRYKPRSWNGMLTAAFFNLTQQNVQTPDPANSLNTIQTGEVRVRGVEVEALTPLFAGWNTHLSYTYNNARVTDTTVPDQLGKHPTQVPDQYASGLLEYTVPKGRLAGLGGGAGVRYVGISAGSQDNTMTVPGYTLYDAALHFAWKRTRFSVNATNLTDRRYIAACSGLSYCNFGYARSVIGTARYQW